MKNELEITDLRSLQEKRERLKLEAKYHRMGIEMHVRSGLSVPSLIGSVAHKFGFNDAGQNPSEKAGQSPAGPMINAFGVWGVIVPLIVKVVSIKATTDRSWAEILGQVIRSVVKRFTV